MNSLPIGIFDSGVGGLTVYRALHNRLPNEHFIYLGDTARVPYGTKSLATVERYAIENSQFLASLGIKMLVVACNTASALALPKIREKIGLDVVGVIGPGGRKAVELTRDRPEPRIGVIATDATVESNAYVEAIRRQAIMPASFRPHARYSFRSPRKTGPTNPRLSRSPPNISAK
jgi:glutamate racemase